MATPSLTGLIRGEGKVRWPSTYQSAKVQTRRMKPGTVKCGLVIPTADRYGTGMFSHIVIFWTKPDQPNAVDALIASAEQHLKPIPGVLVFHVGRMVTDGRPRVESSYQIALTTVFSSRQAREQYRANPGHERFKQEAFEPNCARCLVYDFE